MAGKTHPQRWRLLQFGSLLANGTRNGIYKPKQFHGAGVKIINMGELFAYPRIRSTVQMRRLHLNGDEAARFNVQEGDLLFARRSLVAEGAGKCSLALEVSEPLTFESSIIRARPNPQVAVGPYLYYLFNSPHGTHLLDTIRRQVAVAGITGSDLVKLEIPVPPLSEQRAIAHILGTLDDKIELNRRMNATLESMARALFKAWFVDFEPVRAKASRGGRPSAPTRSAPTLPPHLAALFPSRLVDSELGEVPEGWRMGSLADDLNLTMGQSPPGETYNETGDGLPFFQGRTDFGFRYPSNRVFCSAPTRLANAGDTLVSVRAPVGDVNMAREKCAIGRGVAAVRHKTGSRSYTYYAVKNIQGEFARFEAEGTVFGSISKKDFENLLVVIPPPEIVQAFERASYPFDQLIEINEGQFRTLAALRDALLPKLVSGELRVKDVEPFIAG
jgi:type I restriction enzyme S subunit